MLLWQVKLHLPQKHKATVQDSALRVEMLNLEDQADNQLHQLHLVKKRVPA